MIPYEQLAAALEKRAAAPDAAQDPAAEDNTLSGAGGEGEIHEDVDVLSDEDAN